MIILPNLLCEYEMAGVSGDLPAAARAVEERWSHILRLVPGCEEARVVMRPDDLPHDEPVIAWCDLQDRASGVTRDIVVESNDKRTSHRIELELGLAIPGARIITSLDDLTGATRASRRWVVKHPFGVAGRERVLGSGPCDESATRWCDRQFRAGWTLLFEPWLENGREFSTHWDIGTVVDYVGGCELRTHGDGTFAGVRPGIDVPSPLVESGRRAVERIAEIGYRGPVGVDAIIGELDGDRVHRGVMEINARWTFGRLGLHLARRVGRNIVWRHEPATRELATWDDPDATAITLPKWADPGAQSRSWVEILQ